MGYRGSGPAAGGGPGQPPSGPEATVPDAVLRLWDQAEARLFPLVLSRPDLYQQSVTMISELAARLREDCPDVPALLAAQERGAALVTDLGAGVIPGVAPDLIAAAACAMRYRELVTAGAAARRLAALAGAQEQGLRWTVVEENGDETRAPFLPYQRVEADVSTGRAVIVSIEPDETLTGAVRRLDAGEVDLATGQLRIGDPIGSYPDPESFSEALRQVRTG